MSLGQQLQALRASRNPKPSLGEMARRIGVANRGVVRRWECDVNRISVTYARAYLDALDATAEERREVWLAFGIPEVDLADVDAVPQAHGDTDREPAGVG